MSMTFKDVKQSAVAIEFGQPRLKCDCCKRIDRPLHTGITQTDWLKAANAVGWRHVTHEAFDFDSVCPTCVAEFTAEVKEAV
ncbi:hypothetical protein N473_07055 [Pseudoalteromonas luteoviolacea CPMOR-1]|uniref:Uncharacterized protein n=1 Tax=Pseudoalteromonas luteoviolacea CPMOR-1 TaxID=1365248 RepID=A0A167H4L0_9GAMM|nr:hypothetical protein [Pseudoalteromonas luteoviolacea]KZN57627.1 hypothetical protein N473_07055 [Pseudoalteromonas luteoviolacea CPMOR-1]